MQLNCGWNENKDTVKFCVKITHTSTRHTHQDVDRNVSLYEKQWKTMLLTARRLVNIPQQRAIIVGNNLSSGANATRISAKIPKSRVEGHVVPTGRATCHTASDTMSILNYAFPARVISPNNIWAEIDNETPQMPRTSYAKCNQRDQICINADGGRLWDIIFPNFF